MKTDSDKLFNLSFIHSLQGYLLARGNNWQLYLLPYKGNMHACMRITSGTITWKIHIRAVCSIFLLRVFARPLYGQEANNKVSSQNGIGCKFLLGHYNIIKA